MSKGLPEIIQNLFKTKKEGAKPSVPDNLFLQCPKCKKMIYKKKIENNLGLCPECSYHFKLSNKEWIDYLFDKNSFVPLFEEYRPMDFLEFPNYPKKLEIGFRSGNEGITTGKARIEGITILAGIMNANFIMGSMGSVVGERVSLLFEKGISLNAPVLLLTRSGGARMQEGIISLMQMAKTSASVKKFNDSGNLYITLMTDPTTGGVSASFASLGDIIIAEPGATIGFAGARVIEQTIKQTLPAGFQTSEFLLEKGFIDMVIPRPELKKTIYQILKMHKYS